MLRRQQGLYNPPSAGPSPSSAVPHDRPDTPPHRLLPLASQATPPGGRPSDWSCAQEGRGCPRRPLHRLSPSNLLRVRLRLLRVCEPGQVDERIGEA